MNRLGQRCAVGSGERCAVGSGETCDQSCSIRITNCLPTIGGQGSLFI